MKNNHVILASVMAFSLSQTTLLYAHGEKEHNEGVEYDATSEEFGEYDPTFSPMKTIEVSMADTMRFTPAALTVTEGEIVKFVVSNDGQLMHEFVLGTKESLAEHADIMMKFPGMEHEEPYMAHVEPGKSMEIIWKFSNAGSFEFGCLLPGHFAAGMKGTVTVN